MNASCILLNGDYSFLCVVDWKRAMCLVFADKVKVVKYSDRIIRGAEKVFRAPAVLVLIKVVRSVYRSKVPYSKKNVLMRGSSIIGQCNGLQIRRLGVRVLPTPPLMHTER